MSFRQAVAVLSSFLSNDQACLQSKPSLYAADQVQVVDLQSGQPAGSRGVEAHQ